MSNHHVKLFVLDAGIAYIHHNVDDGTNDDPGNHTRGGTGEKVRFVARDDGGFTIKFKNESPFETGAGTPGNPAITSADGSPTPLLTLKAIGTPTKRFKYTLTLGGITDDPEIIIDNSGQKPKKSKAKKKKK